MLKYINLLTKTLIEQSFLLFRLVEFRLVRIRSINIGFSYDQLLVPELEFLLIDDLIRD